MGKSSKKTREATPNSDYEEEQPAKKAREATPDSGYEEEQPAKNAREATPDSDHEEEQPAKKARVSEKRKSTDQGGGDKSATKSKKSGKTKKAKELLNTVVDSEGTEMFELSSNRFVSVSEYKGKKLVNIREYYEKDGKRLPTQKGLSLTLEQYEILKKSVKHIDEKLAEE